MKYIASKYLRQALLTALILPLTQACLYGVLNDITDELPEASVAASLVNSDHTIPAVSVLASGDSTLLTEGGAEDSYILVLSTRPESDVVITITPDPQILVNNSSSPITFTFTPLDYLVPRTITVTAVDDNSQESTHTASITHSIVTDDVIYSSMRIPPVIVNITDNDTAGVSITESGGSTNITEAGATDTYTVVLTSTPTSPVTVTVTPDGQSTANGGTVPVNLSFDGICPGAQCWSTVQTITVGARNDSVVEGGHTGTVSHTCASTDANYNGISINNVAASVVDDDSAGVSIVEAGGTNVTEGGSTDTYTVVLTSQPTATVSITVTPDAQSTANGSTSPIVLTFDAACPGANCWSTTQTVTVAARNDFIAEGGHNATITHSSASADANYNGLGVASVTASITDNDSAGVTITEGGGSTNITEAGGTDTYTVRLTSEPTAAVTITVTPDAQTTVNGSTSPIALTFNASCPSANCWSTTQTITVAARNDLIAEGGHNGTITHSSASSDGNYNSIGITGVTASITDNDSAGVSITQSGGSTNITEAGGTDTYTVKLTSEPTATVTVTVTPDGQTTANGSTSPIALTFNASCPGANCWSTTQTVTVAARNDLIAEGGHNGTITHSSASSDPFYSGIGVASVTASITDNDSAGVSITQSGGSTLTSEAGGTDTYTVKLTSEPTNTVTVTVTPDGQTTANGSTSPITLTFNASCPGANCWSTSKTVTVAARNDQVAEGGHAGTLTHSASSSDAFYNGIGIASVTTTITDNDTVGFIQPVTSGQTTDGGGIATFTFKLNSQPTGTVVVGLSSNNTGEGTVSPTSMTFNAGNWNSNQTITVTGVNDNTYNSNLDAYSIITAVVTGTDGSGYVGQNPADYSMTNRSRDFLTFRSSGILNGNMGGIAGADATCMADRPAPLAGKVVKAMLVDGVNRRACSSFNCNSGGNGEHIDWVLQPFSTYFRIDGTTQIGSTNDKAVYTYLGGPQTVPSILSGWDGPGYYFTGIRYDWQEWTGHTCNNWTDSSTGNGSCGGSGSLNYFAYGYITCGCGSAVQVICVEQP